MDNNCEFCKRKIVLGLIYVQDDKCYCCKQCAEDDADKKWVDVTICPKCKGEDTYMVQEWLGREMRQCENEDCNSIYEVEYNLKLRKITIKK
ncbi:hypothetical protein [Bacillus cereus]|uniref:hypothetical protein n=1 Tax=Bacillus cereus TaxID=1396 RepID=UPI0007AB92E0|nr:hypothetical protein [Bacillus cereus]HDR8323174.1 hypothetical protein [Bacillus cereus]HDR8328876.1 hypothetical protein [Bacillus cereus]HDR8334310.1 hypothetical protein [Bacillus cereus]